MPLFKKFMLLSAAAEELCRLALIFPRRLRDRLAPFGLASADGFDAECIALVYSLVAIEIERSDFGQAIRKRLRDEFARIFPDKVLRKRRIGMYEILAPLAAVAANRKMRELQMTSREDLELLDLGDFVQRRLRTYRWQSLESIVDQVGDYLEARSTFDLKFSLAVFIADSRAEIHDHLHGLHRTAELG